MTAAMAGIALALAAGLALLGWWAASRRFSLERRVALRRVGTGGAERGATRALRLIRADALSWVARVAGPDRAVESRIARAGQRRTADEHRARQLAHGTAGLAAGVAVATVATAVGRPPLLGVAVALGVGVGGALLPDAVLAWQARSRAARIRAELPVIAELLALAVVAGAGVASAVERIADGVGGVLGEELGEAVGAMRAGVPLPAALDQVAARTGDPGVAALTAAIVTAIERGTPLADVLHGQAAQVRERSRQRLMEDGGKREIAMLAPVVFVVLPVTVVFAMYPGLAAIRLGG